MDYLLNTRKVLMKAPDVRVQRRAQLLQELRDPERLTRIDFENIVRELAEIQASLDSNPPETDEEE